MSQKLEVFYCEASGNVQGGFGIRFNDKHGNTVQNVDLRNREIKYFIPFDGSEKKCWECGNDRELMIVTDFYGELLRYNDLCNIPMVTC